MNTSPRTMPRIVTRDELKQAGFDQTQITRLDELKAVYPYLEFTDSIEEWRRLNFLKWRRTSGHVDS